MNVLIIDIGTSSMRGILLGEDGSRLVMEQIRYQLIKVDEKRIEQTPQVWTQSLEQIAESVVRRTKETGDSIDAVAVTALRSAIIPVDETGSPLMNTIMWQDKRNADICERLAKHNDRIFEKTGARLNTVFSAGRMTWIRENCPEIRDRIAKYVTIPEFVMHYMTGKYRTDVTYGSRSHLMNLKERKWDEEMLELFGVRQEQLCELLEPGSICGTVTEAFAAKTGLPAGIPVITAGGDQQCAAIGQGAFREGTLSVVAGTGGFLVAALDQVPDQMSDRLICNCASVRGKYIVEANVLTCCSAFDWFLQNFYDWDGSIDYDRVNKDLQKLDGAVSSELILPYFQGRSTPQWNPEARAVFGEISLSTDRSSLLKALLEGVFLEIQNNIQLFGDYTKISHAYISGGLTNSTVINQMQADIYGIPLYHMEDSEATVFGALMVSLVGLGAAPDLEAAFEKVRGGARTDCYEPRMELHAMYEQKRENMKEMYRRLYQES